MPLNTYILITFALLTAACSGTEGSGVAGRAANPPAATIGVDDAPTDDAAPDTPASATASAVDGGGSAESPDAEAAPAAGSSTSDTSRPSLRALAPYFDLPDLDKARRLFRRGKNNQAAALFEAFVAEHPDDARARPAKLLGLLARHDGGVFEPTAKDLEALASEWPEMAEYAFFYAGSAYGFSKRPKEAARVLAKIPPTSTLVLRAAEQRAEALLQLNRSKDAVATLKSAIDAHPKPRPETWVAYIEALKKGGTPEQVADARRELAVRFPFEKEGRGAARRLGDKPEWTPEQQLTLARAYFDRHRHRDALHELQAAAERFPRSSTPRCQALAMTARTYDKMKSGSRAWRYYSRALGCKGTELADATFAGGRNRMRAKAWADAERLLKRHMTEFPERSTVDDASVLLAEVYRDQGKHAEADAQLFDQLRRWPQGDKADEASWQLLWPLIERRRFTKALARAEELLKLGRRETDYRAEGRIRYWYARLLQRKGRKQEALDGYAQVLREHPLSWYAVLAYSRLDDEGAEVAKTAVDAARAALPMPDDPLADIPARLWDDDHFRKAVELARMGLGGSARRELRAIEPPPEPTERETLSLRWAKAALNELVGAPDMATRLARIEEPRFGMHWPEGDHRRLWELAHPRPFAKHVRRWASTHGIDPHWIWSIMREESSFDPRAESWANAIGLMQIILPTARGLSRGTGIAPTRANLQKPSVAIQLGSKYLGALKRNHVVYPLASAGYNAGGGAVAKWRRAFGNVELDEFVERIPYREARGYAKRVTRSLARYTYLYGGSELLKLPLGPPGAP